MIHSMCFQSFLLGLFCHDAHLCRAHTMSGLLMPAAHHNFPIALRMGSSEASLTSSGAVGTSALLMSVVGAGVSFPFDASWLNSFTTLRM